MAMAVFSGRMLVNLLGAVLAGVGASACCAGPLLAVSLGFGGAWLGTLTALAPLRPLFIALTAVLFALAFRRLYLVPAACATGDHCAASAVRRRQRLIFWLVLPAVAALVSFPWYARWFY
jgi:mercuric ion transport protein